MAGKKYSAGAIFLQVVPVFANVQREIEREAEKIDRALGDSMEKSGHEAGKRAGKAIGEEITKEGKKAASDYAGHFETSIKGFVRSAEKEIGRLDLTSATEGMLKDLDLAKKKLKDLNDQDFNVDFNAKQVIADLTLVKGAVEGRTKGQHELNIDSNIRKVVSDLEAGLKFVDKEIEKRRVVEVEVDVDTKELEVAERKMGAFEKTIKKTMDKAARHMDGSVNKQVARLRDELDYLSRLRVGIDIGAGQLKREVGEIMTELEVLSHKTPEIDVKVDSGRAWAELAALDTIIEKIDGKDIDVKAKADTAAAERGLFGLAVGGDNAANSFRSFNIILLATATLGPALIPVLGALAGGLLALGPAAAVAGASLGAVIIGFTGIGDAVTALQAQQDQMGMTTQAAAKQEEGAARQIADARRAAADAVENALERQKDAQEAYRDSIQEVRDAEEDLAEARRNARGEGASIKEKISDNALAQDQALLDVFNATVTNNAVQADGSATNAEREQARISLEQARDALSDLRREGRELAKEQRKWREEGVNGTEEVQNAQENLDSALDAQREAYENLGDAARDVDRARADGARNVARAMEAQAAAMEGISAQQNNVDNAMEKLGPAGQKFAYFIQGLKDEFYSFRDDIQTVLLPQIQTAIESFFGSESGRVLREALIGLADSFGRFVVALSASFQGEAWLKFFTMLRDLGPGIQDAYGRAFIAFLEGMASLMTVLAPYALQLAEAFAGWMEAFAKWASSKEGTKDIQRFMDWMKKIAPDVIRFVIALAGAFVAVAVALAPWGDTVLNTLTGFLEFIQGMDPKQLALLVTSLFIIISASQHAYAVMNAMNAGVALLTNPIGLIVFALIGIGLAVAYLYKNNAEFRDFMQKAWKQISAALLEAWDAIKPALMELWDSLQILWKEVLVPFFRFLGPILLWMLKTLIPIWGRVFAFWIRNIAWVIKEVLVPGLKLMGRFFKWLWENALRPLFRDIADGWDDLMTGMVWLWKNVLRPAWNYITNTALPALQNAFRDTVRTIGNIWSGLQALFATPIDFLLDGVINNGIIDGYNTVAGWVGAREFNHIPIPRYIENHSAFATGGIMPGYTPGRDVHSFVSPTAGRLDLSGGEAVMRPEWTQAVGAGTVNRWNAIARQGGVGALRKELGMGGYWMGGVLPLPGATFSSHGSGYSGFAGDLNAANDMGKPVHAWKSGIIAAMKYIGDRSYGRWMDIDHGGQSSRYAHLSGFAPGLRPGQKISANEILGYVGSVGNSSGPHLHFEINGGSIGVDEAFSLAGSKIGGKPRRSIPSWLMKTVKDPLGAVKNWITDPIKNMGSKVKDSTLLSTMAKVPLKFAKATADKVWDIVPGWVKTAAGWAGDGADWVVGGVKNAAGAAGDLARGAGNAISDGAGAVGDFLGLANGGILPYNGTMMYDNGGYLPPGLTSVVNLTGKPEPVFTNDQWSGMDSGGKGGTIHYEPHFEGSDLTAADVAGDLNFTFRKIKREGRYAGVGEQ